RAAVSSAVYNATHGSLPALASDLLLFPRRVPNTRDRDWLHYGVSYSRELFERYGAFREDLRGGEDSEFHQRFGGETLIARGRGIHTLHRHPETTRAFLDDMFRRGHRACRAFEAIGRHELAERLPRQSISRMPISFSLFWHASRTADRLRALVSLPLAVAGAVAYGMGARRMQRTAQPPSTPASEPLHALLQVRDGMRFLPGYLDNLRDKVAGVIALDDGSTDGSREILEQDPLVCSLSCNPARSDHVWDEPANRATLINAAARAGARWVLAIDVDERLPNDFGERWAATANRANTEGIGAFAVWLRELWGKPDRYRVDGIWGRKYVARLFDLNRGGRIDESRLHGHWAPIDAMRNGAFVQSDIEILHLAMISREDRLARRLKYERLDPENRWQSIGYAYLTNEDGCLCRRLPAASMYYPRARRAETDPTPPGLIALLACHNESRFLPGYLDNVAPHVDGIIALDDGSTDDSAETLRRHPKVIELLSNPVTSPHVWHETRNQRRLLEAAGRHGADWLVVVDADERVEKHFRTRANAAIREAQSQGFLALSVKIRELWDGTNSYRCDGLWGHKRKASLFRFRPDHEFDPRPMHNYWAPLNSRVNGQFPHADLEFYHLRMVEPEDRRRRHERYRQLDPQLRWQPQGYDYLLDEEGIELAQPVADRHFA
ncbi:MAG: hypothetical protein DWQ08_05545, partial [Proteobacteria bacterium]